MEAIEIAMVTNPLLNGICTARIGSVGSTTVSCRTSTILCYTDERGWHTKSYILLKLYPTCLTAMCTIEDLCDDVVDILESVCKGAGDEVDCPRRDMVSIISLLTPGGYRLRVAACSGWNGDQAYRDGDSSKTGSSIEGVEVRVSHAYCQI